jgi:hypothetical protein
VALATFLGLVLGLAPYGAGRADLIIPNGNPTGKAVALSTKTEGGSSSLGPPQAGYLTQGNINNWLMSALSAQIFVGPVWQFKFAAANLTGDIKLDKYEAWADSTPGFKEGGVTNTANDTGGTGGGANIGLNYIPKGTDPTDNVHWVQVIRTNDPSDFGKANGTTMAGDPGFTYYIDDGYKGTVPANPFYDSGYAADSRNFIDNPSRDYSPGAIWNAEVFLVTDAVAGGDHIDTVYNGVYWGFATSVPEPNALILSGAGLVAVLLVRWTRRTAAA